MSRCFPFPPPGYEKKPRSFEHDDLLAKEREEKKHKKKRDKERRESKERKDKDNSKDKHKERKERKEKHKDRQKDKDRSRTSEDRRAEQSTEIPHEVKPSYDSWKAEEIKDSKFTEELGRRIRDGEQGAANQMGDVLTVTSQRETNIIGSSAAIANKSVRSDKMVNDIIGTVVNGIIGTAQRRNESASRSVQKRIEDTETATALEKQKASKDKPPDFISTKRKRNESFTPPIQKRSETTGKPMATKIQRVASNQKAGGFNSTQQGRNNATGPPTDNFTISVQKRIEDPWIATALEKQRASKDESPHFISTERKSNKSLSPPVQKEIQSMGNSKALEKHRVANSQKVGVFNSTEQRRNDVACRPIDNFTVSVQKRAADLGTAAALQKQRASKDKSPDFISTEEKRNGSVTPPVQRRIETTGDQMAVEKQRVTSNKKVVEFNSTEPRRNIVTGQTTDNFTSSVKRTEDKFPANPVQMERVVASNAIGASTTRKYAMGQPPEAPSLVQTKMAGTGAAATTEKQGVTVPNAICTEKRIDSTTQQVEKDLGKKKDGEKKKEKKKGEGHKDRDRKENKRKEKEKKRKEKEKGQHKEKEKEEEKVRIVCEIKHVDRDKVSKGENDDLNSKTFASYQDNVKLADKPREHENNNKIDCLSINPLASYRNNVKPAVAVADGNNKKRKELETNGFLHEPQPDVRPNKLLRTYASSFHPPVENGKILEFSRITSPCSSLKLGAINNTKAEVTSPCSFLKLEAINNTKAERGLDSSNKTLYINGKSEGQASSIVLKPAPTAVDSSKNGQVLPKPPHLDSKYLSTIYSVPKMEELLENDDDDDEWLLNSENPRPRHDVEVNGTAQVWATGMQIEAADVFALPYVVPF